MRWVARRPRLARVLFRPAPRLAALACVHAGLAWLMALVWPVYPLLAGPLLFGPAHLAADYRYLCARRKLSGRSLIVLGALALGLFGLSLAGGSRGTAGWARAEIASGLLGVALMAMAACGEGGCRWRATVVTASLAALAPALTSQARLAHLCLAHGHNLVALVVAAAFLRRRRLPWAQPLAAVLLAAFLLAWGRWSGLPLAAPGGRFLGVHIFQLAAAIAPGLPLRWAVGAACAFAFLQSVHYMVWLWAIPQLELAGGRPLSFTASARGLQRDMGDWGVRALVSAWAGLWVAAFCSPLAAQAGYLKLVGFHAWLELALGAFFWVRGRM